MPSTNAHGVPTNVATPTTTSPPVSASGVASSASAPNPNMSWQPYETNPKSLFPFTTLFSIKPTCPTSVGRRGAHRQSDVGHVDFGGCTRECFVDVCKMIELSTKKPRNFQRNCEDSYNSRCLFLLHLSFSSIGLSVKNLSSFHGEVFLYNSKLFLGT